MSQSHDPTTDANQSVAGKPAAQALSSPYETGYPAALYQAEEPLLRQRPKSKDGIDRSKLVGFGLSGGGIRSATFCLGLFQGLAKRHLLGEIDYISSVSGGSYFASFYGRLFTRKDISDVKEVGKILSPDQAKRQQASQSKETSWKAEIFDWMRDNGRFLAPRGGGDLLIGLTVMLRNWVTLQLIIATAVLALFLAAQMVRVLAEKLPFAQLLVPASQGHFWWSPYLTLSGLMVLIWVLPFGWAYWMFGLPEPQPQETGPATGQSRSMQRAKPGRQRTSSISLRAVSTMLVVVIAAFTLARNLGGGVAFVAIVFAIGSLLAALVWLWAWLKFLPKGAPDKTKGSGDEDLVEELESVQMRSEETRYWLSAMLRTAMAVTAAVLAFALIDTAGQTLYARFFCSDCRPLFGLGAIYGALAAVAPFGQWVAAAVVPKKKVRHLSIPLGILAGVGAAVVILPVLIGLDLLSHAVAYDFGKPADAPPTLMAPSTAAHVEVAVRLVEQSPSGGSGAGDAGAKTGPCQISIERGSPVITCASSRKHPAGNVAEAHRSAWPLSVAFVLAALFSYLAGAEAKRDRDGAASPAWIFLNRTSLNALYASRLIRAYLGASNRDRHFDAKGVSEVVPGDDISHQRYWFEPDEHFYGRGAPLHLVNMTINETMSGETQIEQRDRKGLGLAVGPGGLSAGVRHHAVYVRKRPSKSEAGTDSAPQAKPDDDGKILVETFPHPDGTQFRVFGHREDTVSEAEFKGEKLSLGHWTSISGAAVSTGMGFRSSLGLSLLTGFFNVRLGYWWDSGIDHSNRGRTVAGKIGAGISKRLPVQGYLIDEFLSRFHGTARRRWYLSDGGNFENLGAYELIRRRLPLMIVIDAGADPDYDFDDVAGLVRKARLDFNAEIEFLDPACIKKQLGFELRDEVSQWYGPLEQLRRGRRADEPLPPPARGRNVFFKSSNEARYSLKHAALARVRYLDGETPDSILILIKPTLVSDEPSDVLQYHSSHPSFPHESTADQFFDEAQWESYRRLGQHIAEKLFATPDEGGFLPKTSNPGR